jgi:hypothetical protein
LTASGLIRINCRTPAASIARGSEPPDFFASTLVETHGLRSITTSQGNKILAIDEGVGGIAPQSRVRLVDLFELFGPKDFATLALKAKQVPFGAERVDAIAIDDRGTAGTCGIGNGVTHRVLMLPQDIPVAVIEAENTFRTIERLASKVIDFGIRLGD